MAFVAFATCLSFLHLSFLSRLMSLSLFFITYTLFRISKRSSFAHFSSIPRLRHSVTFPTYTVLYHADDKLKFYILSFVL